MNNDTTMIEASPTAPIRRSEESRLEALLVAGGVSDSTRTAVLQQFEQQKSAEMEWTRRLASGDSRTPMYRARSSCGSLKDRTNCWLGCCSDRRSFSAASEEAVQCR